MVTRKHVWEELNSLSCQHELTWLFQYTTPVVGGHHTAMGSMIEKTFIIVGVTVHTAKILNNICTQTTSS